MNCFVYALLCVWIQQLFGDFGVQIGGNPLGTSSVRVLLIDDFEPYRCFVASVLWKRPELQILSEVSDGLEAVQKAKELEPDLILLEIELPNLNGIEAASRIRQVSPGAKIIFLTQNNDKEVVAAAWITGAHGYVLKTDAGSELLTAVAAVLRGDEFISSGIKRSKSRETEDI
jgi:two-component system nitrate/nitrite response regulator NarL